MSISEGLSEEATEPKAEVTEQTESLENSVVEKVGKFKWEAAIIGVLKKAEDKTLSIKRLRKKVCILFGDCKTSKFKKIVLV